MKLKIREIDGLVLLGGVVTEFREGTGNATGRVVNIKLKGKKWDGSKEVDEIADIAFWNNEDSSKPQLADNVKAAGLTVGRFITVLTVPREDGNYSAIRFQYSGAWRFPEKDGRKELNVFVGTIANVKAGTGRLYVSIPTQEYNKETRENETIWNGVTFWNNEENPETGAKASNLADRAAKCFVDRNDGFKPKAVVVAGENKPYNGYDNYTGYSFDMLPEEAYTKAEAE